MGVTVEKKLLMFMFTFVCVMYIFGHKWRGHRAAPRARTGEPPAIVWLSPGIRVAPVMLSCGDANVCKVFPEEDHPASLSSGAYIFLVFSPRHISLPKPSDSIVWGLFYHESVKLSTVFHNNKFYGMFNFSATFSVNSDVPFPLTHLRSLSIITSMEYYVDTVLKNSNLNFIFPVMYLQSDCNDFTERDQYVVELMKYIPVDSYGVCEHNKMLPYKLRRQVQTHDDVANFISQYKFVLAIENCVCEDYFTEKIWRPIEVGAVPIYFGATSIRSWLPNERSAILIEHYPTPKLLSEHLYTLLANDSLYEEYLEHKTRGLIRNKRLRYELTVRPYQSLCHVASASAFECFICRRLHELRGGRRGGRRGAVSTVQRSHHFCPQPKSVFSQRNVVRDTLKLRW